VDVSGFGDRHGDPYACGYVSKFCDPLHDPIHLAAICRGQTMNTILIPPPEDLIVPQEAYLALAVLLAAYLFLAFTRRLPTMQSFKDLADVINTAGGHILLLSVFTIFSIRIAMHFIYFTMDLPGDTITKAQAEISVGISFVTGTLAGTFIGALLKTMSGGKANGIPPPSPDKLSASVVPPPEEPPKP
jgi:hypothetical protein